MKTDRKWYAVIAAVAVFLVAAVLLGFLCREILDRRANPTGTSGDTVSGAASASTTAADTGVVELVWQDGEVRHLPVADFNDFVQSADRPVFVDFWAQWCGPCLKAAPFIESLAKDYAGQAYVVKVNVDMAADLSSQFNVSSIPYFVVLQNGKLQDSMAGYAQSLEDSIRMMLDDALD
ncbi:MAG TPA: hypothetical protein DD640_10600 [Clostridiales bacterium]|nr:hypothetical protein [Clostridiales bacterium]